MPKYMLTYLGGDQPASPEEGQKHFAKYKAWLSDLGDAIVSPANPLKSTCIVTPNGDVTEGNKTNMSGFTVVQADSMESALEMAKSCPFLKINGSLEVSEMIEMNM
jgi:hypothetical protein